MLCFYYCEICDTNLIDPIPACAGMTRIIAEGISNSRLIHPTNTFVFAGTPGAGMTGYGSKCVFLNSLTTPGCAHPSNGGELGTCRRRAKFPSAEGWAFWYGGARGVWIVLGIY